MDSANRFLARHEFLIRRLHSLSGLIPVGAFLIFHLLVNASIWGGAALFQSNVDRIHTFQGVALIVVEWTFIFLPLLFHAIVGFVIIGGAVPNTREYPYRSNVRYLLQRITGMVAFVFILYHVWQMHHLGSVVGGGGDFNPDYAASSAAGILQRALWLRILYGVGVAASVYHLANGLWTMGITWGIWTTPEAQKRADRVCIAFGIALFGVGIASIAGFERVDVEQAEEVEQIMLDQRPSEVLKQEQQAGGEINTADSPADKAASHRGPSGEAMEEDEADRVARRESE